MPAPPDPFILALTPEATALAKQVKGRIGGEVSLPKDGVPDLLREAFLAGRPIVGICAAGILIRSLTPVIASIWAEPPVVAVADDGASVVPLLGGHHGANALARDIADLLNGHAAVPTAGDLRLGVALDAPPDGWVLENPLDAKAATAALLAGASAALSGHAPWLQTLAATQTPTEGSAAVLSVDGAPPLVYRRRSLVLGLGASRGADPDAALGLVQKALADAGYAPGEVAAVASVDLKSDEAAIHHVAEALGVEARFFPADRLEAETPRLSDPSSVVFAEIGCHGVAEAAALVAAGPDAVLAIPKQKSKTATVAAAVLGPTPETGVAAGHLSVVGIGPGTPSWRTPEASRLIAEADDLVGYSLYLDLLGPLAKGKTRHDFPLGEETDRCRHALVLAASGRRVALICSGDGGIYAMGALVMELLDTGDLPPAARRVGLTMAPGISALQAASARTGALLGHDFCAISLSDLLTPRDAILKRLKAAAEGDFVIALYNPVSRRRRTLLAEARDILLAHRPEDTPVILAQNLGRPEEMITHRTLKALSVDEVDMLTTVLIGASSSRAFRRGDIRGGAGGIWAYTPRGYDKKGTL